MSNFTIAKEWGIKMASMANKGGLIGLGLIGSGLDRLQITVLFQEINQVIPVKFIDSKVGIGWVVYGKL